MSQGVGLLWAAVITELGAIILVIVQSKLGKQSKRSTAEQAALNAQREAVKLRERGRAEDKAQTAQLEQRLADMDAQILALLQRGGINGQ